MKDIYAINHSRRLAMVTRYYDLGGGNTQTPAPRNLTNEMLQTLAGFQQTAGPQLALNQQYDPQYAALTLDTQRQNLYGYDDAQGVHHPGTLELGRAGTQYQRAGDISDVAALGPASTAAFLAANPYLAGGLKNIYGRLGNTPLQDQLNAAAQTGLNGPGADSILGQLNAQAQNALASGGQLSPQELRANEQATRSGFAARGNAMGNQSLASELLGRDAAVRQRLQQAQQLASGVQGLNLSDLGQRQQFALGAQQANQAQNDFGGRAAQIFSSTLSDPFQAILGRPSGAGTASQQQIGTGAKLFDPLNPYAQDVYNTNYNAQAATNIANANQQSAQNNAYLSAGVGLLGALLSDARLKKDVKATGKKTPEGIPIKTWKYKTDPKGKTYEGVVAQDVKKIIPNAVLTDPLSGVMAVDYNQIRAPFSEARAMLRKAA